MNDTMELFEESFTLPKEIKNDIIYCQMAMRHYIKVHHVCLLLHICSITIIEFCMIYQFIIK